MSGKKGGVNYTVLGLGLAMVVPVLVLFWTSFGNNPREVPSVLEGTPAPAFAAVDLDGDPWDSRRLKGTPMVLNFWSTWCGPCKQEHPYLQQAAELYPDVQFLGVLYSDEPAKGRRYLERVGTTYDHLIDPDGAISIDYGVAGVPETYFIDAQGVIVHKQVGPVNGPMIQALVARMMGGAR